MDDCLVCNTSGLLPFLSLGKMPIANRLPMPKDFKNEYRRDLTVAFCPTCTTVQRLNPIEAPQLYHDEYTSYSGQSKQLTQHFRALAADIMAYYLPNPQGLVVEIGSNDGILLQHLAKQGVAHVGVEPCANVAGLAQKRGVNTCVEFFNDATAAKLQQQYGQADVIVTANALCRMPEIGQMLQAIKGLLKPKGVLIVESPYVGDMLRQTAYDQIHSERVFFFGVQAIKHCFELHGLQLIDVLPLKVRGGSMRYIFATQGAYGVHERVQQALAVEEKQGLHTFAVYEAFAKRVEQGREQLKALITQLRQQGKKIVGYGATAKSCTLINYCGLTHEHIKYISDTTPIKQGRYSPGAHIPVKSYEIFQQDDPDYAILFSWSHAEEIMEKEQRFTRRGGKWIVFVPEVAIVDNLR